MRVKDARTPHKPKDCPYLHVKKCPGCGRSCACYQKSPQKPSEKLCLWCKNFDLDTGSQGYSEWTPGSDFRMKCSKHHWDFGLGDSESHFAKCIIAARTCKDYDFDVKLLEDAK